MEQDGKAGLQLGVLVYASLASARCPSSSVFFVVYGVHVTSVGSALHGGVTR